MPKAIVTAIIGERHRNLWQRHARDSWQNYASRHGYEIILLESLLDDSAFGKSRLIPWQKLLILSQPSIQQFERVVWIDSDIIINPTAPDVAEQVPLELIGAVPDQPLLSHPVMATVFQWLNPGQGPDARSRALVRSGRSNIPAPIELILNTGVLVLSPEHRQLLEHVYQTHNETPDSFMEQMALSYEMLKANIHFPLDPRFNCLWQEYKFGYYSFVRAFPSLAPLCVATALANNFFLHFAGFPDEMALYDPAVQVSLDQVTFPTALLEKLQSDISAHRR